MDDSKGQIAIPQKELDAIKASTAKTMLSITKRTVEALDKLSARLDIIDDAFLHNISIDDLNLQEMIMLFQQAKESFKLRQDFLRALAGYDVDTSKVPAQQDDDANANLSEEEAAHLVTLAKAEIENRDREKQK